MRVLIEEQLKKKEEYEKLLEELGDNGKDDTNSVPIDGFLEDIYKKTELCLALLYSDRTKCKNELKNLKTMIKNMAEKLKENTD